jgi:peroxiredoxin
MPALVAGQVAPEFELATLDGKTFQLKDALAHGPVVLAFFKVSCPTCHYAFPFYERVYQAYRNKHVTLVGVSQNDAAGTAAFAKQFGVTFPILLDDTRRYPVSNAYKLTNVPTIFWVAQDGEIEISSVGWSRADFEQVNRKIAEAASIPTVALFRSGEDVLDYRAG